MITTFVIPPAGALAVRVAVDEKSARASTAFNMALT
jgi:hypothetical protein